MNNHAHNRAIRSRHQHNIFIPNTAVFGPTNFIGTTTTTATATTATTARMKISGWRFLEDF